MPKLYKGKRGGVYYKRKGRKVYVTNRFGSDAENKISRLLPNSFYDDTSIINLDNHLENLSTLLNPVVKSVIEYFTKDNSDQPKSFTVKLSNTLDSYIIPKKYDNEPVLIFDLDKTIDNDCITPLFHDLVKKFPKYVYVVTARPDAYMYYLDVKKLDKLSKEDDLGIILHNGTTKAFKEKLDILSNVYCRNWVFQYIAEQLYKKIHGSVMADGGILAGYVKMIQLLHIKSSIGCEWKDMYFFDDSSDNLQAWKNLKELNINQNNDNISRLKFIGGEDKCVFNDNDETYNHQTYKRMCCDYQKVFGDLDDCFVYAEQYNKKHNKK